MKQDVYDTITQQIIADLDQGVRPWLKPWKAGCGQDHISLPLRATGEPYRGINILALWCQAVAQSYVSPHWMTFRQAQVLGAHVRNGERATSIVYAGSMTRTESDEAGGHDIERHLPFLKSYAVFNADQIEDLPEEFMFRPEPRTAAERIAHAEAFAATTGADIRHGGSDAYYRASTDHVQMPPFDSFVTAESYYATLKHELVHWTGPASTAILAASVGVTKPMPLRNSLPSSARRSSARNSPSPRSFPKTMPHTSPAG